MASPSYKEMVESMWPIYAGLMSFVAILGAVGGVLINVPQFQVFGYIIVAVSVGIGAAAAYLQGQGVISKPARH